MNPFLQRLGFGADDRVVIVHADDVGMCHATIPAAADLFDAGLVSSAAAMVPCGWFPAAARHCREAPTIDMGVHVTLTCEWQTPRWAPISPDRWHCSAGYSRAGRRSSAPCRWPTSTAKGSAHGVRSALGACCRSTRGMGWRTSTRSSERWRQSQRSHNALDAPDIGVAAVGC